MLNLILAILLGGIFAYFAIQNSVPTFVSLGNYLFSVPLYIVALGSLLLGVVISGLLSLTSWAGSAITISSKDNQLRKTEQLIAGLKNQINNLLLENSSLKGETSEIKTQAELEKQLVREHTKVEERSPHISFWDRLRYRLAI